MTAPTLHLDPADLGVPVLSGRDLEASLRVAHRDGRSTSDATVQLGWSLETGRALVNSRSTHQIIWTKTVPAETTVRDALGSIPIRIPIPHRREGHPATFEGQCMHFAWFVRVGAGNPTASLPMDEHTLLVQHPAPAPVYEPPAMVRPESLPIRGTRRWTWLLAVLFALAALGSLASGSSSGLWFLVPAAAVTAMELRRPSRIRQVGVVESMLWPSSPATGGELHAYLRIAPTHSVPTRSIRTRLTATEQVIRGEREHHVRHVGVAFDHVHEVTGPTTLEGGTQHQIEAVHPIPSDAPASYEGDGSSIRWTLRVEIAVKGAGVRYASVPVDVR